MKNKNKVLFASTTAVAVLLSACNFTEVSVQEKFSNEISKIAGAETIQGIIDTSYILDKELLLEKGFSNEEIEILEKELQSSEFLIEYKSNKEQVELIIKGQLEDEELGLQLSVEIPVVIDLKENKVYVSFNPFMENLILYTIDSLTNKMTDMNASNEEIKEALKEPKEELKKYKEGGIGFIDLTSYLKENSEDESVIDLLSSFNFQEYDLINKNEKSINKIVDLINTLDKEKFTISKEGEIVTLNLDDKEFNSFNNVYSLYPKSKLDKKLKPEEDEDNNKANILSEYMSNNQYESLGKGLISYKLKDEKLDGLTIRNTFNIKEYSYEQRVDYKSLKINKPVEFKHKLEDIKVFTKEESEEEIFGMSMMLFVFVMAVGDTFSDETDTYLDENKESVEESVQESKPNNKQSNTNFDWDNWEDWEGY